MTAAVIPLRPRMPSSALRIEVCRDLEQIAAADPDLARRVASARGIEAPKMKEGAP